MFHLFFFLNYTCLFFFNDFCRLIIIRYIDLSHLGIVTLYIDLCRVYIDSGDHHGPGIILDGL